MTFYVFDSLYRKSLKTYMESDEFPLMKEYKVMRKYTEKLRIKYAPKTQSQDDWFFDN